MGPTARSRRIINSPAKKHSGPAYAAIFTASSLHGPWPEAPMAQTRTRYFFPLSKPLNAKLADTAFTAGLLHDIGKLLLAGNIPDTYDKIIEQAHRRKAPLLQVELKCLRCTHAEAGGCLLGLWGLPLPILEAIAWHLTPARSQDQDFNLLTSVHVADALDREKKASPGECPTGFILNFYLEKIGLGDRGNDWRKLGAARPRRKRPTRFKKPSAASWPRPVDAGADRHNQPRNAAWTAFIAASPLARSITTEILISLVEIISMFTPSWASVSKIFPATPLWLFMPTPTNGFDLQENGDLNSTNWLNTPGTPATVGNERQVVVPAPAGNKFYRLRKL